MKRLNKTKKCESKEKDADKEQFKKDWKLLSGMMKGKCKPKGQKEFDNFKNSNESSEQVCDWCGIPLKDGESVKHGKYTLCQPCASGMCEESVEQEEAWLGLKGVYLFTDEKTKEQFVMYHGRTIPLEDVAAEGGFDLPYDKFEFEKIMELAEKGDNRCRRDLQDWVEQAAVFAGLDKVDEGSQEDALAMPSRIQEIEVQLQNNTQRLYNMLADEYLDNDKQFDELLEERDALVEELCGCRGLVEEETYEDKVHRDWLDVVQKHKSERQAIKDRIRDIVGDDKADDVFGYWDRIQSSFNMRWKERDGFSGTDKEHLARLAKILGPEGRDIIDDINAKFTEQAKELSDYYATHDYTGD